MTIIEMNIHNVLKATKVGSNFLYEAQTKVAEVSSVKKYSHHSCMPKIKPGTMITALVNHDRNSTVL